MNQILQMKPSGSKISLLLESYYENTSENYRDCYVAEKRIVSKLSNVSIPNFNKTNWLETLIKSVSKFQSLKLSEK